MVVLEQDDFLYSGFRAPRVFPETQAEVIRHLMTQLQKSQIATSQNSIGEQVPKANPE